MTKYLSRSQVEQHAAASLRAYSQTTGRTVKPPIEVDLLGELLYELRWEYDLIEGVSEATLAALYPENRVVRLNEAFADRFEKVIGLDRFTKAHEIGHWVLHVEHPDLAAPALDGGMNGERVFCRDKEKNWTESQADWFAAALLMPEELLVKAARQFDRITWKAIDELCAAFKVSKQAMKIRLERLNLAYIDEGTGQIFRNRDEASGQRTLF